MLISEKLLYCVKMTMLFFRNPFICQNQAMLFSGKLFFCQQRQCCFSEARLPANINNVFSLKSALLPTYGQCCFPETRLPANINNVFFQKLTPLPTYGQCCFPVGISRHFQAFDTALIPAPLISGWYQMYLDVDFSILQSFFHRAMLYPSIKYKSSGQGVIPYRWYSPRAARHDSVKLRSRQYSLDERRYECRADALCL